MSFYPEQHGGGGDGVQLDPLERARLALDFEALNSSAPPVREILYRAQMLGPIAPVREAWRPHPAAAFAVFAALIFFAPWVPQHSSLTVMTVAFEKELDRRDADALSAQLVRNQPDNVLVNAQFTASGDHTGFNVPGRLKVTLTAFDASPLALEQSYRKQISSYRNTGLDPMFRVEEQSEDNALASPARLALGKLKPADHGSLTDTVANTDLAKMVLDHQKLLASAAAPAVNSAAPGVKLRGLGFGNAPSGGGSYDFTVPAWPAPMGFSVDGYSALPPEKQAAVREAATRFLDSLSLSASLPAETSAGPAPGTAPLLEVRVLDVQGNYDPQLSAQVQAWVTPPDPAELRSSGYDPQAPVRKALEQVLPNANFSAQYDLKNDPTPRYVVTVSLAPRKPGLFEKGGADAASQPELDQ